MCLPVDWPGCMLICLSARSGIGQSVCPCIIVLSANAVCVSEAWFAHHIIKTYVYKVLGSAALGWQGQQKQYSI